MLNYKINSKDEMAKFAIDLAKKIEAPKILALSGTLGVGKSFFAKNFINFLQKNPTPVLSPTFNLVYNYQTIKGEIYHFDLYRLKSEEELENIGFFDAINNYITLIEWPEIAKKYLSKNILSLNIEADKNNEESRIISINYE
ncbi:MAG: tRNA (adenosine(37)-N6)-threonylcarbamoyltransferase complex ATPase subunit type 1 TsaE [Alphaproteobacteria bacterium]